jgi:hypothetical protein
MGFRLKDIAILAALVILALPLSLAYQPGIFFSGISTDHNNYDSGSSVLTETTIMNKDLVQHQGLYLSLDIIRKADGATVVSKAGDVALAAREVKLVSDSIELPLWLMPGTYMVVYSLYSASGIPVASISREISVSSPFTISKAAVFGPSGVYLKVPYTYQLSENISRKIIKTIHGTVGETIPLSSPIEIEYLLSNKGSLPLTLEAEVAVISTYTQEVIQTSNYNLGVLLSGESKTYSHNLNPDAPGTYRVVVSIYSNKEFLCRKEVRAVLSGEGGKILGLDKDKDFYSKGERVRLVFNLVGPADKSAVEGAMLEISVFSEGASGQYSKEGISLGVNPSEEKIEFSAPFDLKNYEILAELKKGGTVFDSVSYKYSLLEPVAILSDDGRIQDLSVAGCFDDGICTEEERALGDCLDCMPLKKSSAIQQIDRDRSMAYIAFGIFVIAIICVAILVIKR